MKREVILGLFATVVVISAIFGFKFLKGENMLSSSMTLYAEVNDANNLIRSAPVLANGFQVGIVKDITIDPNELAKVILELRIDEPLKLPKSTVAQIFSTGFVGGMAVRLVYHELCNGDNCIHSGEYLRGLTVPALESLIGKPEELKKYTTELEYLMTGAYDTLVNASESNSARGLAKTMREMNLTLVNLRNTTSMLSALTQRSNADIAETFANLNDITSNLKHSNNSISELLQNTNELTGKLKELPISRSLDKLDVATESLDNTLSSLTETSKELNKTLNYVNESGGTLGKLIRDDELYNNLNEVSTSINLLMEDIRLHPERYRRILSKKKMPYESPDNQ